MLQPYLLELDGMLAGRFLDFHGGMAHADVIHETVGARSISHKHLGAVSYDAMILACGAGMSRSFYQWIGQTFDRTYNRRSGAVIFLDAHSKSTSRREFREALIVSVTLPDLKVSENKDAVMLVKIQPENTSVYRSAAAVDLGVHASAVPNVWKTSGFQIHIDGLDSECRHVTQVDSIQLKMGTKMVGSEDRVEIEPTKSVFSDVDLELPGAFAEGFMKWHQDSVMQGTRGMPRPRNGRIEFSAPVSDTPYFSVELKGLGIAAISALKAPSMPVKVGMYCESMSFSAGGPAIK